MRAVLFDMDGTLVDSEKLWDIAMQQLYAKFGGVMTPEVRNATVGGSAESVIKLVFDDLGLPPEPQEMAAVADWLHEITGDLFDAGLPWCEGARELLEELAGAGVPMALVTNTRRALTERALNTIGRDYFTASVCGDEVTRGKPAPDPYRQAAALLGFDPAHCLAIEDSVTGTASAESAGCPVLVVPNDVEVPGGPRRRHITSLADVGTAELRQIFAELNPIAGLP
jgi:HAD superfamily hydrolase (TIGR01509 family)